MEEHIGETVRFLRKSLKSRENFENYPVSGSGECTTKFSKVNYDTNNDSSSLAPVRNDDKVLTSTEDVGTSNNDKSTVQIRCGNTVKAPERLNL